VSSLTKPADKSATEELRALIKRAQGGDESTLPVVRQLLQSQEAIDLLGGDLARQAERSFLSNAAGKDLAFREALAAKLARLRAELGGPNPTPLERLLVERVVACWLQVQDADIRYAQGQANSPPLAVCDFQQRRMDRAHRRYMTAIKTLATVRKLALPVLQVNIAGQQVNVAKAKIASSAVPAVHSEGSSNTSGVP
jgi:hypothetical protein